NRRRLDVEIAADEIAAMPDDQPAEDNDCELDGELDGPPQRCGQLIDEEADADVDALPAGEQPAEHREPYHQEARDLIAPDQRIAERPRRHAEHDAEQEQAEYKHGEELQRAVEPMD